MRFVWVFHSEEPDFIVVVPYEVEDVDLYLDSVLHGASGWGPAFDSIKEAVEWGKKTGATKERP